MSLNGFIAVSVLACDFLIYVFFQWTFGGKRRDVRRELSLQVAKEKNDIKAAPRPFLVGPRVDAPGGRHRVTEREVA